MSTREARNRASKNYRDKNKDKQKAYRLRRKEELKILNHEWYLANKERIQQESKTLPSRYKRLLQSANTRGKEVFLTEEEYVLLMDGAVCYLCGNLPLTGWSGHGLDRVDNEQGYTLENVKPCCIDCNRKKFTRSLEVYLEEVAEQEPEPE